MPRQVEQRILVVLKEQMDRDVFLVVLTLPVGFAAAEQFLVKRLHVRYDR
ncbi:hypothetical protein COLU111180_20910 [Cohnella lubricantis]|uniref:Uncharacterized protein n=1 Tax=Cohnella lubricantis TaxID=2163172 RepID=A0A841TM55_9BACL|nr:hypothetical protein [Cohnella lubricantis]MBB6679611.1 hypothetical protein [Cohnella lubricantis]MBP2120663.1 hypothetical protein [Cohnella lubricantis]